MSQKNYYIDKEELNKALIDYKNLCDQSAGGTKPPIPNYIGDCFYKLAVNISYSPNFIGYSYKDEMIGDGIENVLKYFHNYDPEKSTNPFGYFTTIIWYAFLRRIAKEKREMKKKQRYIENYDILEVLDQEHGSGDFSAAILEYLKNEMGQHDIEEKIVVKRTRTKRQDEVDANPLDFGYEESDNGHDG